MVSSRKLSSDEVDALIEGLQSDDENNNPNITNQDNVRPFKFGTDDLTLLGDYYALRMINERFARFARAVFLPMLRIQPRISSFPPEVKTFDEYTSGIESFMSLTASRIEELRGNMMLVMDPIFISILTNSFYGGQLGPDKSKKTEFTSTEDRLIEIISEGLNRMLETAWKDLMPINLNVQGREVNPQFVSFVDGSELVIICSFVVQLPGMDAANFDIIYPLQTLKPIASLLRSKVQSDKIEDDVSWRQRLENAVLEVPLKLKARLSKPVVSMSKLINLKPGEVIPIQLGEGVEVRVENKPIFLGEMGEVSGQSAVNLNKRITS